METLKKKNRAMNLLEIFKTNLSALLDLNMLLQSGLDHFLFGSHVGSVSELPGILEVPESLPELLPAPMYLGKDEEQLGSQVVIRREANARIRLDFGEVEVPDLEVHFGQSDAKGAHQEAPFRLDLPVGLLAKDLEPLHGYFIAGESKNERSTELI